MTARAEGTGHVLWVSTAEPGGIDSAVRSVAGSRLGTRWRIERIVSNRPGSVPARIGLFLTALVRYTVVLLVRRPDLVHLHSATHGSLVRKGVLLCVARAAGVPVVLHMHSGEFPHFVQRCPRLLRPLVPALLAAADTVVALGEQWAQSLRAAAPRAHVVSVPNAVTVPAAVPERDDGGPVRVVFLGVIGWRKATFVLLDAWAKLRAGGVGPLQAQLVIAGSGEVERARDAVAHLGLDDCVRVRTWLSPAEVGDLLTRSDVLALPSRAEGLPMAILEGMAQGLCVIGGAVGAIPELLDGGAAGMLVAPGDVDALASALRLAIDDPALRRELGAAAHRRAAAHYDLDVVWRQVDAVYRDVLDRRTSAAARGRVER